MSEFSLTDADLPPQEQTITLDMLLREAIPEVKLALGDLIDRENQRPLPGRYARLLPDTLLIVTLRNDAAEALLPIAREIERELTDSCMRHGTLYDRGYRTQLRRAEHPGAPLFTVSAHPGAGAEVAEEPEASDATIVDPAATGRAERDSTPASLPTHDPDATQLEGFTPSGWEPGRWVLIVGSEAGEDQEAIPLTEPLTVVGRRSQDPALRAHIALRDVPHVSRQQLALVWEPRDGAEGFRVYNLGRSPVTLPEGELPGAGIGRGVIRLHEIGAEHAGWIGAEQSLHIGSKGPTLRIEQVPQEPEDPDATRYE